GYKAAAKVMKVKRDRGFGPDK
ncbi:MAG: hypothetical protein K0S29_1059, partial [Gammaproteobacteria bacterium]|nr:hypothetical protein [Gammaproteobacteria bacterium]